jgi:acetyl-CoA carboxylase biotin carboxylase subunit
MFRRILIANRGEIALRVIRSAREMGIECVAVYSDFDSRALHTRMAQIAVPLGGNLPSQSYLVAEKIIAAAQQTGAEAIHPGYGFLSENAKFARAVRAAGLVWIGPPPEAIEAMGDKIKSRQRMQAAGVPVVPGLVDPVADAKAAIAAAEKIGYPIAIKAAAGGGGKGIRIVRDAAGMESGFRTASGEAQSSFGDGRVYLERYLDKPRHIEVQLLFDTHGNGVHYGVRECSIQRRHQKLLEECPSVVVDAATREAMGEVALKAGRAVGYQNAGTVEFLWSNGKFYFLEMNTRLQVEHPVTEMRFGVDLVREQIRVGNGEKLAPVPEPRGHAIEVRVNAEDPDTWLPSLGRIRRMTLPGGPGVRLDSALFLGLEVTPYYDSMLAKLVVHAADRPQAIARAERALRELRIVGVATSLPAALRALQAEEFKKGDYDTGILERVKKGPSPERVQLAMLAAAAARFLGAERAGAAAAAAHGDGGAATTPRWGMVGRTERLRRPPR